MEPVGAARPGSRSGARAATGAGPHWCRERLIAAAPGRWRDGTGAGPWLCRPGWIRAAGGRWAAGPPRPTGMRHGLKRPRLVLAPDRQPKLRPQRVGLLNQLFLAIASGSLTRTTP